MLEIDTVFQIVTITVKKEKLQKEIKTGKYKNLPKSTSINFLNIRWSRWR
jgi:hypothetical protein